MAEPKREAGREEQPLPVDDPTLVDRVLQPLPPAPGPEAAAVAPNGEKEEALEELRRLLLHPERERIQELETKEAAVSAGDVSSVLPEAFRLRGAEDERLAAALAPTIEAGIETSARRNPKILADAIFPVLGPAIRKAIQAALASALEGFNAALENSLSLQSLRWRWEARRTGRPFSEIVLLKSLVYRVEQVFLVHRETGLLLADVADPSVPAHDADLVSSMLQAISSFVKDSFASESDEEGDNELQQITVSGRRVVVVRGPHAALASVVRGTPPPAFRLVMQRAIEAIHLESGEDLAQFDGDDAPFRTVAPHLESCLQEQRRERKRSPVIRLVAPLVVLSLIALAVTMTVRTQRRAEAWEDAVAALDAEPGIVFTRRDETEAGWLVRGLRDELSRPPETILSENGVDPATVAFVFEPYQSERFALERAHLQLQPPETVGLDLRDGVLHATGRTSAAWIRRARNEVLAITGVDRFDGSELESTEAEEARARAGAVDGSRVLFLQGTADLDLTDAERARALPELTADLRALDELVREAGLTVRIGLRAGLGPDERERPDKESLAARRVTLLGSLIDDLELPGVVLTLRPGVDAEIGAPEARLRVRILPGR